MVFPFRGYLMSSLPLRLGMIAGVYNGRSYNHAFFSLQPSPFGGHSRLRLPLISRRNRPKKKVKQKLFEIP